MDPRIPERNHTVITRVYRGVRAIRARCGRLAFVVLALAGLSCSDATAPPNTKPPYLAIVTHLSTLPGVAAPPSIRYHVTELSGTLGIDTAMRVPPSDTVIIPVPPATYVVELGDVPANCYVEEGNSRAIVLSTQDNTGIIRYEIQCRGALNIMTATDGYDMDESFIYRLQAAGGPERLGTVRSNDTLVFSAMPAGTYTLDLAGVSPNCVVTSEGGSRQTFTVDETGGVSVNFRVQCARESERPHIVSVASGYVLGASVFTMKVFDPNRDIEGYAWNVTDCRGNSILPDKREQTRRALSSGRGRLQDTLVIVGAYEVGLPTESMQGRCTKLRVFDNEANSSEIVEHRIGVTPGRAPQALVFNAKLVGTQFVQTTLDLMDPDNDLVGIFVGVRLRDGTLGVNDGKMDFGIMDPAGYVTAQVPNLPTTGRIKWDGVYAVVVWAIDKVGNVIMLEDPDVFQ